MKHTIKRTAALLLVTVNILTLPALAASSKTKEDKTGKKAPSAASDEAALLSLGQAKEIALAHAGVTSADAEFTKEELDKTVYKLKFRTAEAKYEYEVSALDGSVLSCKVTLKEPPAAEHSPAPEECPGRETPISAEQAQQLALEDAGLELEALKYVTCYLSWSDHAPYAHEVKFSTRTEHYHYTIDCNNSMVLDSSCQSRK